MTFEELIALPENGGFDYEITEITPEMRDQYPHGKTLRKPVMRKAYAGTHEPNDVLSFEDKYGSAWTTIRIGGELHKQRIF